VLRGIGSPGTARRYARPGRSQRAAPPTCPVPRAAGEPVAEAAGSARTYTRAEAARSLDLTERSVRRYVATYPDQFRDSDALDDGSIARLRMIRDMKAAGAGRDGILAALAALNDSATSSMSMLPSPPNLADVLAAITHIRAGIERLERAVDKVIGRLDAIDLTLSRW
jgi:hypothetical protein